MKHRSNMTDCDINIARNPATGSILVFAWVNEKPLPTLEFPTCAALDHFIHCLKEASMHFQARHIGGDIEPLANEEL